MTPEEQLARLRRFNARVRGGGDRTLHEEGVEAGLEGVGSKPRSVEERIERESIVMRTTRPVLAIARNKTQLVFREREDSEVWKERLTGAAAMLEGANRAVGRIELHNHRKPWVGTGWLVADDILVTNRHVADEFIARRGEKLVFKPNGNGNPSSAAVDFLQEIDNRDALVFELIKALHVEPPSGPDVSFFAVAAQSGDSRLARPIPLSSRAPSASASVGVIGYPARDPRIPEPELMMRIFGDVFEKKRFAPGAITRSDETRIHHDCSTLGGNSGSVVLCLRSGEALGLHYSGGFMRTNFAVRADLLKRMLDDLRRGTLRSRSSPARSTRRSVESSRASVRAAADTVSLTIPLTITVSVGGARPQAARPARVAAAYHGGSDVDDVLDEAVAEDYADREGYDEAFLGDDFVVPLPEIIDGADDVLEYTVDEEVDTILRYQHFSVVMCKSRRMCFYSAVNIDGAESRKTKRTGWRFDPRIDKADQIKGECYGNPPKFSRGHMTRREDPAWGSAADAFLGNDDSMHVTNAVPQMQAFNSPIWLGLEDYALQHAREDDMRISVITGPYLSEDDPVLFEVQVPTSFWKIIVFIHDETGELCATGYEMTDETVSEDEFVFGEFDSPHINQTTQVPIATIEARAGISFGDLASADPMADAEEAVGELPPLGSFEQIRFKL